MHNGIFIIGNGEKTGQLQMVHHLTQPVYGNFCQLSVADISIHAVIADLCRVGSVNRIYNHIDPIALSAGLHTADERLCNLRHIYSFKLSQAVGTVSTVIAAVFSKIPQDIIPETIICKAVKCHFPQALPVSLHHDLPRHGI